MEFDRAVQIWVDRLEGRERKKGLGSGYLVAPRLVLTTAHVLHHMDPDADNPLTVTLPDTSDQQFPAVVRWQPTDDRVDAALIEIAEGSGWQAPQSLGDLLTRPPQRYGLIIGTRPREVTGIGFPRMQKDGTVGQRGSEQFFGHIAPGTGSLASRYELISRDPTFAAADTLGGGSRWSGMSGAAVLTVDNDGDDLLCGVVRRDRQADAGGTRLTATPAASLLADKAFRDLITEHTGWEPALEPVEPSRLLKPAAADRSLLSPAALLRADAEAVTFHGRDTELADLQAWCENGTPAIQVRVLTGPGGQGKTRLARRLTDTLSWDRRWATGHLRSDLTDAPTPGAAPADFATLATSLNLLLVVDYAETRLRLVSSLITHLHRSRHRVRVLLLARSDGPWRTDAAEATPAVRDLLNRDPVVPLAPLIPTSKPAQDRHDAFRSAAQGLAFLLPLLRQPAYDWTALAATLRSPADLHDSRYDNVLTLQMTALVALLQHGPRPVDTASGTPLEATLLLHEKRFWKGSAKGVDLTLPISTLGAAVAVASLCGAGTQDEAKCVMTTLPDLPDQQAALAAKWVRSLYPPDGGRYWGSLQPDRIAEYHASYTLTEDDSTLPALLGAAAPGQQAQLVTVLARASIAHYNADRASDSEHVLRALDTALDIVPLAYRAAQAVSDALPYPSRITSHLALRLTTNLVHAYQQWVVDSPDVYESGLAISLTNLSNRLAEVGRKSEALAPIEQAVEIARRLAVDNAAAYEPDLAKSLTNLDSCLGVVGRHDEAVAAGEEAVEIHRRLAVDNAAAYEPGLATSLSNLASCLGVVGRHDEAVAAGEEAVEIHRRLAVDNAAAYEPGLATSLSNLGIELGEMGCQDEAVAADEEAVEIHRRLAVDNAAAYEPGLATSLTNLGLRLAEVGRGSEALAPSKQAVEIRRRLAVDNAAAYEPALATSLANLGDRLAEVGRKGEALAVTEEAVKIHRRLAVDDPAVCEPDLARWLTNLGDRLAEVGRKGEALAVTEEAVEIRHRLAVDDPAVHESGLAISLANLGDWLAEVGRKGEALAVTEEAVEIRHRLAVDDPAVHEPPLSYSLTALSNRLVEAGREGEALAVTEEAVKIHRRLAVDNPAVYRPVLADSLINLTAKLAVTGDLSGALRVTGEAVELFRKYLVTMPSLLPRLHDVLGLQAELLEGLWRPKDARKVRRWLRENPLPRDSH
ncbi:tetratricopeptide repeat protein [Streptomyces sp. NPDC051597]|uniref:tetratricopeptide repeat protein n=1 Tax=Streptomyces sp. NPDC051597 TaxID=3155049 RepID=UPI003426D33B